MDPIVSRVVARTAGVLTRNWLLGVKKGWNAVIRASKYPFPDKFEKLHSFLKNLHEQVLYQQHGFYTIFLGGPTQAELSAKFEEVHKKLDSLEQAYTRDVNNYHDADIARQDKRLDLTGQFRYPGGVEHFIEVYPEYKPYWDHYIRTMEVADVWSRTPEKALASATRAFEAVMKILYTDAKQRLDYDQQGGDLETKHLEVERIFDLQGMKVIIVDFNLNAYEIRDYIKYLDRAHQLLNKKGLGKLWYGVTFVESKNHKKTPEEMEFAKKWGYNNSGSAGEYDSGGDRVYVTHEANSYVTVVAVHELGHRYWYKFMRSEQRARFNSLVRTKASEKYRDYPQGPTDDEGNLKPVAPFDDYAESNIEEAFAMVFESYCLGKDLDRDQLESFRSVLSSIPADEIVSKVAERFLLERWYFLAESLH